MSAELVNEPLPRRDLILLPLVSIVIALLMVVVAECIARQVWVENDNDTCLYDSPTLGPRHKANCVMDMKNTEGPWVHYAMNNCGYRGQTPCGPKPPGTLRVVILGTSTAFGLHVPYERYFANRASAELSRLWKHPVEFQNLGEIGFDMFHSDQMPNEAMSLNPDAIFFVVSPYDLTVSGFHDSGSATKAVKPPSSDSKWKLGVDWGEIRLRLRESRSFYMAQHFMLEDPRFFLRAFTTYADPNDLSRVPPNPEIDARFADEDALIGRLAVRAHRAQIPLFVIPMPNRAQAALIGWHMQTSGFDASVFPNRIKALAAKNGAECIDMLPAIQQNPHAEKMYYSVDGHPNAEAHEMMARVLLDYFRQRQAELSPETEASTN